MLFFFLFLAKNFCDGYYELKKNIGRRRITFQIEEQRRKILKHTQKHINIWKYYY